MEKQTTLNYTFEERLKEVRADKGVGQVELAKAIGVSRNNQFVGKRS